MKVSNCPQLERHHLKAVGGLDTIIFPEIILFFQIVLHQ